MLEKNKDYIELSMRTMMSTHRPYQNDTEIAITGMTPGYEILAGNPFDIPCEVVVVPKRAFDRLQADDQHYRELAKQREHNYELLLTMTGFNTLEELTNYIHDAGKNSKGNWKTLKEIADDAEEDYISERDKAEALQTENEQLKKKLNEFDPIPEFKELLKRLYSTEDVEKLEWTLNHVCGGMGSVNGWRAVSSFWSEKYKTLSKLVGFSSVEEIQDYLTNEAECDTLHEAILKLIDENKYACEEWGKANSNNNSWKAAALCDSPKELMAKIDRFSDDIEEWQKATGCSTPDKARERIADMMGSKKTTIYLGDTHNVIARWQKVTGCNEPKDFLKWKTNIEGIMEAWKSATGCKYPAEARILLEKWKVLTKCETPEAAATWITSYESACERGNNLARKVEEWEEATGCPSPSSAKTAIEAGASWHHAYNESKEVNKKFADSIKAWQNVTGYSTPEDYLAAVTKNTANGILSWQKATGCSTPEEAKELIDGKKRHVIKLQDELNGVLSWEEITGFSTPEKCSSYIDKLEEKLENIKDLIEED